MKEKASPAQTPAAAAAPAAQAVPAAQTAAASAPTAPVQAAQAASSPAAGAPVSTAAAPPDGARGRLLIRCRGIVRTFGLGTDHELEVLHGIDLDIYEGEFVAIVGASGSGKSTLMNIIGALDKPTAGSCVLDGVDVAKAGRDQLSDLRNRTIGFVFQSYNLIQRTTALENVEVPLMYAHLPPDKRRQRAREMLTMVGMAERMGHLPSEMSGGQQQRVAIARAMANDPAIILADEPTGALDSQTGHMVMDLFHELHDKHGKTILFITHSPGLAEECGRVVTIKDGRITGDRKGEGRGARQY